MGNIQLFSFIGFEELLLFTKHLGIMLKSGVSISEAIEIIKDQTNNNSFKTILIDIEKEIKNGHSLFRALSKHPKVFNSFYLHLVKVGEESGNLEKNLIYLADSLKKIMIFKKKYKVPYFIQS